MKNDILMFVVNAVCVLHVHLHITSACALLFTLFPAQFLVHFLSNGGDRGLRI